MKICQAFLLDEEEGQLLFHAFLVNNTSRNIQRLFINDCVKYHQITLFCAKNHYGVTNYNTNTSHTVCLLREGCKLKVFENRVLCLRGSKRWIEKIV